MAGVQWATIFLRFMVFVLASMSAGAQARETLTVAHDQWVGYAGFFIAQSQGYFAAEGLDIKVVEFSGPGETLPPLIAGHVDIALTTLYNLAVVAAKGECAIEAVYLLDTSNGADAVVAGAGIHSVADLKGKSVAVTVGEVNELLLMKALEAAHLPQSTVHFVNLNADDAGAALLAGRVDAAVTWEPWVSRVTANGASVIFSSADVPNLILDAVAITRATAQSRHDAVARFLRALDKGVGYLRTHLQESRGVVAKALNVPVADMVHMMEGDRIYGLEENRALLAPGGQGSRSLATVARFIAARDPAHGSGNIAGLLSAQILPPQQ
jgi:NitT/TauT family transport system substrate-binding protein